MHWTHRTLRRGLALIMVLAALFSFQSAAFAAKATPAPTLGPANSEGPVYDPEHPEELQANQLYAEAAILIDADSGKVLFEKEADAKMYPASTTKIMTLMLALEYGHLDDEVTIPQEAAEVPGDSSLVPVTVGEKMTFRDLLYGFMIRSGNDAGNAIAVIVSGSVDKFVEAMNQRAQELGCENTHFTNPHGYHDEEHYTTARDLATIARAAMKNELFRDIVATESYTMPATNKRDELVVRSSNQFVVHDADRMPYMYEYGTGIKTGYHSKAGQCFVGSATKDGVNLISVVLKSTVSSSQAKWLDSARLMEYGFSKYEKHAFADLYALYPVTAQIGNVNPEDPLNGQLELTLVPGNDFSAGDQVCTADDLDAVASLLANNYTVEYTHSLEAPIVAGDIMGTLTYTSPITGESFTATLIASRDIAAAPVSTLDFIAESLGLSTDSDDSSPRSLLWILIPAGIVLLIIIITVISLVQRHRRKMRYMRHMRARMARERRYGQRVYDERARRKQRNERNYPY